MERFKYRRSIVYLTHNKVISTRNISRVELYLRVQRVGYIFPPDCLIIARISFRKERAGNGTHLARFLSEIAVKYGFRYIGIESVNEKSKAFAEKSGFYSIDGSNYAVSVEDLTTYFQDKI